MKTSTRLAVAFLAMAGTLGTNASADQPHRGDGNRMGMNLAAADRDDSGDISFEEFAAAINGRIGAVDADGDGKVTVGEIATEIQRMRAERQAHRIVKRFDADGDGVLTAAEIEQHQRKRFALLDRNDDGKIAKDELPRRAQRHWKP